MAAEETKTDKIETRSQARKVSTPAQNGADAGRDGVAQELRESHERRTSVPGVSDVDARLDNRTGADRPPLESWPAKPQQVDGPDVAGQVAHTRKSLAEREE